jgi:hypothetical protein
MPSIDELSTAPVIHTTRPDGALLTAIRVPLDDLRLNRWGWMLYISQKDNPSIPSDLEALTDHAGQRYPKIYTLNEVKIYAAKWGTVDKWGSKEIDWKPGYWESDPWGEVFASTQNTQKELQNLQIQLTTTTKTLTENFEALSHSTGDRSQAIEAQSEMIQNRFETLSQAIEVLKRQYEKREREQTGQKKAKEQQERELQEKTFAIAQETNDQTTKIISAQTINSNEYYRNVVEQSRKSFNLSVGLVIVGLIIFSLSMGTLLLPIAQGKIQVTIVGILASAITETVASLSFLYNKASDQFTRFHLFLDRNNRAAIAHAMCNGIKDEARKQEMIILIIQDIMKNVGDTK